jgi:ligand-binding sensor domain-containing protein
LAAQKPVVVKVLEGNATGPVNDVYVTGSIVWAASTDRGIVMTDLQSPANSRSFSRFNGTDYTKISRILCDRAGTLWFLAGSDIIQSPGSRIGILSAAGNPVYENIHSLLCDREGNIWFSNDKGLFITRKTGGKQSDPEAVLHSSTHPGLNIISLYEDREGDIWIGTFGSGLFRLDPETRRTTRYTTKNGLANDNILSIAGVDDQIWFATLGGASRCRLPAGGSKNTPVRFEGFSQESGLGNNFIYTVFVDSRKRVWFGTDGKGISVYENGKFINYSDSSGFKSKVVYSVTEDQDGHIWFSTSNEGLFEFDMHTFRNYGVKDGLSSLSITSLTGAGKSGIFIVHPEGIDILDPATGMFSYLGHQEGIENINPDLNTLGVNPANEKILVGTSRGIILITPGAFSGFEKPVVRLTEVSIFLEATDTLSEHISAYDRNHFTFAYAGLWYQAPDRVRYQVMLNGYDLDWISTRNTSMVYSSLEPGEYTFRVRASLNDDFSHASTASYHFIIRRPPWKTPWFITMLLLLTGIIIYLVFRAREKRLIREENLSREKIIFQFETLKSQVNPHFLFNSFSTLSAIIDEDREMALDYIQKLSVFFRNILEYQDKSLITLKEELALADTYYYLQKKRYGPSFSVTYDLSPEHLSTYIPPLTLQMILENAVKHNIISTEKPLSVRVYSEGDTLVISNPNQPRPDAAVSTGIGLKNIMNRYRLLADKGIEIRGTSQTYTVILPVIKTDLS